MASTFASGAIRQERIRIRRVAAGMHAAAFGVVAEGALRFVQRLRAQHLSGPKAGRSVNVKSGRLRASARALVVKVGDQTVRADFSMGVGLPHGRIHITGGTIRARRKSWLHFRTDDGKWHKVKSVYIPARVPFFELAREEYARIRAQMKTALARVAAGVA